MTAVPPSNHQLWKQACSEFPDYESRHARWLELLWQQGPGYVEYADTLVHRALAKHRKYETCDECPLVQCHHCGTWGRPGEDHSCPCPNHDNDCTEHPDPLREVSS